MGYKAHRKLPYNLFYVGFLSGKSMDVKKIDVNTLEPIRQYIRDNWQPSKKLYKTLNSFKLSDQVSTSLGIEVSNGQLIAAAILEGYRYEQSVVVCLFYMQNLKTII